MHNLLIDSVSTSMFNIVMGDTQIIISANQLIMLKHFRLYKEEKQPLICY